MEIKGRKVSVVGLGISGVAAANFLRGRGADVFVSELKKESELSREIAALDKKITIETGRNSQRILDADLIVKSPGISDKLPVLAEASKRGIPVLSEIEVACNFIKPHKLVAVTGTNGKTTTVTLLGKIFGDAGYDTVVAGNIGSPLSSFVDKIKTETVVVLEVSSYQLENTVKFKPDISCLLNITPDHLEHHGSMGDYILAKKRLFANQDMKGYCVFNNADAECRKLAVECKNTNVVFFDAFRPLEKGFFYENGSISANYEKIKYELSPLIKIPGRHNIENVLAAAAAASLAGVTADGLKVSISAFEGVEHRIEFIKEKGGIKYVNDSKSTNVDSTMVALESIERPVLLIMGGRDKGAPYTPLYDLVKRKVQALLLIGEAAEKIKKDLKGAAETVDCGDLKTAVLKAVELGKPGATVLLSPGCSSFDQFDNFEHRGRYFKELVKEL